MQNKEFLLANMLRGKYSSSQFIAVIIKLLAIYSLSKEDELPGGMQFNKSLPEHEGEWQILINNLKSSSDKQVSAVYSHPPLIEELPFSTAHEIIQLLVNDERHLSQNLSELALELLTSDIASPKSNAETYADLSLYKLTKSFIDFRKGRSIYITSPSSLPIAAIASEESDEVFYETSYTTDLIADALSIISKNRIETSYTDILKEPNYKLSESELKTFEYGVSFSTFGVSVPKSVTSNRDKFNRFNTRIKKIETANILHLLQQCRQRFIVSITDGTLYSTMERDIRKKLIDEGLLKAVIALPQNIWKETSIKTALLIIEPNEQNEKVRFLDISGDQFIEKSTKRRIRLTNFDKILSSLNSDKSLDWATTVSNIEIQRNDYSYEISKYILSPEAREIKLIHSNTKTLPLKSIVNFERGLPFNPEEGNYTVLEVGASELNDIGDISPPTKEVKVSEAIRARNESGFLQPNDIVLILKGSAGKVGLVPENVPTKGNKRWMINRSGIVLRAITNKIDAKSLYAYLASELGQAQLSELIKGASIPNLSLKELKEFHVIIPSKEEKSKANDIVDKGREIQQAIDKLTSEQYVRQSGLWSLQINS